MCESLSTGACWESRYDGGGGDWPFMRVGRARYYNQNSTEEKENFQTVDRQLSRALLVALERAIANWIVEHDK
jgi:hypothetical protein